MPQPFVPSDPIASITAQTAAEIAESVRDLVDTGQLAPGAGLPPVRTLAEQLEVNRNTVVAAYGLLVQAGVAVTRGRAGTRIIDLQPLPQEGFSNITGMIPIQTCCRPHPGPWRNWLPMNQYSTASLSSILIWPTGHRQSWPQMLARHN